MVEWVVPVASCFLVISFVQLLVSCALFAWRLRGPCVEGSCNTLLNRFKAFFTRIRHVRADPSDPLHERMQEAATRAFTARVWKMFQSVTVFITAVIAFRLLELVPVVWESSVGFRFYPHRDVLPVLLIAHCIACTLTLWPHFITPRIVTLVHVLAYGLLLYHMCWHRNGKIHYVYCWSTVLRAVLSISHGNLCVTICVDPVFCLVSCLIVLELPHFILECFVTCLLCISTFASVTSREAELRARIEATISSSFKGAADDLLMSLCDAVTHLSGDLRIIKPSPHLAATLLRSPGETMEGVSFMDLINEPDCDKNRLLGFLNRDTDGASTLHVFMRDANGTDVRLQLFHTRGIDLHSQTFHIIGLREDRDDSHKGQQTPSTPCGSFDLPIGNATCNAIDENSSSSGSSDTLPLVFEDSDLAVAWVKAWSHEYPLVKCTAELTALCGPAAVGTTLSDWAVNKREFTHWLQFATNFLMHGGRPTNLPSFDAELNPPHCVPPGAKMFATLRAELDIELSEGQELMKIRFENVHKDISPLAACIGRSRIRTAANPMRSAPISARLGESRRSESQSPGSGHGHLPRVLQSLQNGPTSIGHGAAPVDENVLSL